MGKHNKICPACGRKMKNRPDWRDDLQLHWPAALFLRYELEKGHGIL